MQNRQKKFFDRARAPWRGRKKAHRHISGVKKIFFNPIMMGIKKRRILRRFQKYKLVLGTKCP
jgi:hypothetical protein